MSHCVGGGEGTLEMGKAGLLCNQRDFSTFFIGVIWRTSFEDYSLF